MDKGYYIQLYNPNNTNYEVAIHNKNGQGLLLPFVSLIQNKLARRNPQ